MFFSNPQNNPMYAKYYFGDNRFKALVDSPHFVFKKKAPKSGTLVPDKPKVTHLTYPTYSVLEGKEELYVTQREPQPYTFLEGAPGNFVREHFFVQKCIICRCQSHTPILCPLRKCCCCGQYGHADVVCTHSL